MNLSTLPTEILGVQRSIGSFKSSQILVRAQQGLQIPTCYLGVEKKVRTTNRLETFIGSSQFT